MTRINLKEKIERARAQAKEIERKRPPEPTLKVKGFWQKKSGDNDNHSSFVAKVTGIGYDPERSRDPDVEFRPSLLRDRMDWEKGFKSRRNQDLVLPEGIYKARLFSCKAQEEPDWKLFAVVS
jgi:hypothetical protein